MPRVCGCELTVQVACGLCCVPCVTTGPCATRTQLHRLAELSDNVAMAMERMDRTHTALKATTEALSEREGQLADLVEQDRLSEEVKALSGPGTKVGGVRPCTCCVSR